MGLEATLGDELVERPDRGSCFSFCKGTGRNDICVNDTCVNDTCGDETC